MRGTWRVGGQGGDGHGINDNVVHNWRKVARDSGAATVVKPSEFVPVTLATACPRGGDERAIEIELRRGAVTMKITWPSSAAADLRSGRASS